MSWFLSLSFLSQLTVLYLVLINIAAFFFFGWDKLRAQVDARRVSERRLWLLAAIGGSAGGAAGREFFPPQNEKVIIPSRNGGNFGDTNTADLANNGKILKSRLQLQDFTAIRSLI